MPVQADSKQREVGRVKRRVEFSDRQVEESPWWSFQPMLLGVVSTREPTLTRRYDVQRQVTVFEWEDHR